MVGIRSRRNRLALVLALACMRLSGQTSLSLEEVGARNSSDEFRPAHLNERVSVRGIVNSPALHFPDHTLLAIDDGSYGAILRVTREDDRLDPFRPGDELAVDGVVGVFAGMPVIQPAAISKRGIRPAPAPIDVPLSDLLGNRFLGRLVRTTVRTQTVGDSANGAYLSVDVPEHFTVFIPRAANQTTFLRGVSTGDLLQVTGVAYQYCARPPFNRNYQLLVQDPAYLIPLPHSWMPPALALGFASAIVLFILLFVWVRERRMRRQRERLRKTYHLGEELLGSVSVGFIIKRLREALPEILRVSRVQMFLHNRAAGTLDSVAAEGERSVSFPTAAPAGEPSHAAAWSFQYNAPLAIPDPGRSPFTVAPPGSRIPKSLLFVPMFAQGDVVGVLELDREDGAREFTEADQELAQHLANQAAVSVRLADQRSVQEQLFRTEKLAAVGRLITGVVDELRAPLETIERLASRALMHSGSPEHDLSSIADQASKATRIVTRLVSYASTEPGAARPVPINALLRRLVEFREGDWKASGIRIRDLTTREPLAVLGSEGQLEQVFLNLLVHAEQALANSPQKLISIRTSVLARRVLIEIVFTGGGVSRNPLETAAVLGVTRSIVAGHGGEVRLIEKPDSDPRFEVDLPLTSRPDRPDGPSRSTGHPRDLTALVIENDESDQRQMVALLSARGARVVPVDNADTGLDLAHRLRFDIAFCAVHAPGLNWVELSESLQSRVAAFVLVSDRFDPELAADFEGPGRFVLPKPLQEPALDRVLDSLDPPMPAIRNDVA